MLLAGPLGNQPIGMTSPRLYVLETHWRGLGGHGAMVSPVGSRVARSLWGIC